MSDPTTDILALTSAGLLTSATNPEDPKNKRKYTCPSCHLNLWGKPGLSGRVQCVECNVQFADSKELVEIPAEPSPN